MKVLFVGESWSVSQTHTKGFDFATLCRYEEYAGPFMDMLRGEGIEVDYMPSHVAQLKFPMELEELQKYNAVIFSDIGSNSLLLHPDTNFKCVRLTNRLALIKEYVAQGGAFLMCGGYMSYSGIEGKARYAMTPIADILPVTMLHYDDRMEHPEGIVPVVVDKEHPIMQGIDGEWPWFLGYNKLAVKPEASLIATVDGEDAFLAAMDYGKGRTVAYASDCVPHWGSPAFVEWEHYKTFFVNILKWLSKEI